MQYNLIPRRPYMFKAYYEWLLDNNLTPYILVDTSYPGVIVPNEQIIDNKIVLNISPLAIGNYVNDNKAISFSCRFNGEIIDILLPFGSLIAIYAKENAQGLEFDPEIEHYNPDIAAKLLKEQIKQQELQKLDDTKIKKTTKAKSSHLKIIK